MTREEAIEVIKRTKGAMVYTEKEKEALETLIPELAETEYEKIRKVLLKMAKVPRKEIYEHEGITKEQAIAYLEKQKELPFVKDIKLGYPGHYFYDGERMYFCDSPAMEEKQEESSIAANDLDEEIYKFFDDCIDVHEAKLYGSIRERVIPVDCYEITARHFAKWAEEHKEPHYTKGNALFDKCVENCDSKTVEEVNKRVDDIMNMPELSAFEQALTNFIGYWEDDEEHWPSQFVKKHGKHILDMAREELQKEQPEEPKIAFGDWGDKEKKEAITTCLKYMRFIKKMTNQEYDDLVKWLEDNLKKQKPVAHENNFMSKHAGWSEENYKKLARVDTLLHILEDYLAGDRSFCDAVKLREEIQNTLSPWLKNLCPQPKNEWSEEDEEMLDAMIDMVSNSLYEPLCPREGMLAWLKSLRPSWKPSEELKQNYIRKDALIEWLLKGIEMSEICHSEYGDACAQAYQAVIDKINSL